MRATASVLVRTRGPFDCYLTFFEIRVEGGVGKLRSPVREESGFLLEVDGGVIDDFGVTGVRRTDGVESIAGEVLVEIVETGVRDTDGGAVVVLRADE